MDLFNLRKIVKLKGISFHATVDDDTHSACRIVLFTFPVRARLFCLISRANDACLKERITTDQPLTEGNTKFSDNKYGILSCQA